jgi:hypothetical protein
MRIIWSPQSTTPGPKSKLPWLRYNLEYHLKSPGEKLVDPINLVVGENNVQNNDTNTQYAEVMKTGGSSNL